MSLRPAPPLRWPGHSSPAWELRGGAGNGLGSLGDAFRSSNSPCIDPKHNSGVGRRSRSRAGSEGHSPSSPRPGLAFFPGATRDPWGTSRDLRMASTFP
jgi:hypothetical protein